MYDKKCINYPSIVTFYFLPRAKSKTLIMMKKVSREFYNGYITKHKSSKMDMNVFDIDKNGLVIEYRDDATKDKIDFDREFFDVERKEHYQRDGIVLSHYVHCKALSSELPKKLINMIQKTYKNFAFKRGKTSDNFGMNLYQGKAIYLAINLYDLL